MGRPPVELAELVEHWTVQPDEMEVIAGKRGPTRLGFALLLKFYSRHARFPHGRAELSPEVVDFVARQVQVDPAQLDRYEWAGRTIEYHRGQVRRQLGFRECSNAGPRCGDGRIVGGRRQHETGDVELQLLEDVGADGRAAVETEAASLSRWFAGTRVLPRFPSPLSKTMPSATSPTSR